MSYRDVASVVSSGSQFLNVVAGIPGLGQILGLADAIGGAFATHNEQDAYNQALWKWYATPVSQGGGWNPGTKRSRAQMRARQRRHFATYFR